MNSLKILVLVGALFYVSAFQIPGSKRTYSHNEKKMLEADQGSVAQTVGSFLMPVAVSLSLLSGAPMNMPTQLPFSLVQPAAAYEADEINVFNSICMGFGCGAFNDPTFAGAPKPADEDSISYMDFLKQLDAGKVEKVDFFENGNRAYAYLRGDAEGTAGTRIRIGEGYPIDQTKGWSSPLWVVRSLENKKVPYQFSYDLSMAKKPATLSTKK
mmetsp:Transcript_5240/g.9234  ORF Transcript_5240/g.9234 Transcript_5240/m.9234 type:complete len:213 (-) Transcript_5240:100-738(-)